jgi:DeoR/GlpR family transcriptional regulator of sugar metabolism
MLAIERRAEIMSIISNEKSVRVNELSEKFEVTEETIRRDLDKLDKEGKIKKTYGGAVLVDLVSDDLSFSDRLTYNMKEKQLIASYANACVDDGETVFIDMSTTALELIKQVDSHKKFTVITNSLNALVELSQRKNITLIAIGGSFNESTLSMEGPMTTKFIDHYFVDKTFFSVKAISKERGIMDSKEHLSDIKRHMIENAKEVILLIDSSKFNHYALMNVVDLEKVDKIVTDYRMNQEWEEFFEAKHVEVLVVK